ncbi:MAG: regulatory signaling modulator protein AmpE [Cellvibrionaceae bacterium]
MIFLSVIIVFLIVQWWGSSTPFHSDQWFRDWHSRMDEVTFLKKNEGLVFAASILGPVLLLLGIIAIVGSVANWLLIIIFVPVLLYSLGRGEFTEPANDYLFAWNEKNWEKALENYFLINQFLVSETQDSGDVSEQRVNAEEPIVEDIDFEYGDWVSLNHAMLKSIIYKGFESLFAVLFWFILLGPVGALIYRLVSLFTLQVTNEEQVQAKRWLWLLEWPAVRILGATFALTGSFVGCIKSWQEKLLCAESTTTQVLEHYVNGALDIDESVQLIDVLTQREFKEIISLYSRTLIFWVCLLAVLTVLL